MIRIILASLVFLWVNHSAADEIRPGYLELNQETPTAYAVLWKVPNIRGKLAQLKIHLPEGCVNKSAVTSQAVNNATLKRWYIQCVSNLPGQRIFIEDAGNSNTDVLLRLKWLDGSVSSTLLKASSPSYIIPEKSSAMDIAISYTGLGVEHILAGVDHLLFVFALLLIVKDHRRLILTITAFTLAHSITLCAATLGFIHVSQQPVEAVIALSILFLAVELVHGRQGRVGMAAKWPWLVAFIFGLLHGFGFAGALAEIGLPEQAVPMALIFFNVGVEIGQLIFIAIVIILAQLIHRMNQSQLLKRAEIISIYAIGGFSSFWLFERISLF
ncbi:Membrane protein [hydrothermal vent metagenome]|uniref:Membrane protein n=1 Tax=hydrothermal vent metagenome TaxID=652676 RepID=A0A3B1B4G7_9ZZZZ